MILNDITHYHLKSKHLVFAKCCRRGVEGVSKVEHGSARWGQGVFCGVEVGPGQPAGQVGLEPLHLLLLPLEEQLCFDQTFISCPLIQPAEERRGGWMSEQSVMPCHICILFRLPIFSSLYFNLLFYVSSFCLALSLLLFYCVTLCIITFYAPFISLEVDPNPSASTGKNSCCS